jgi:uncharacterized protein YegJ (DUF2314 family)
MSFLSRIFGGKDNIRISKRKDEPDVYHVNDDEQAMADAIEKVQLTLHYFKLSLLSPLPQHQYFSLKARLREGENVEHIWLTEVSYDDSDNFYGHVGNVPLDLTNIKEGQKIGVSVDDVTDWMIVENGRLIGGYTLRVLRENMNPKEREAFDNSLSFFIDEGIDYFPHDFSTPEGAILCLEDAYNAKDIDRAVSCKDFLEEAKVSFSNTKFMESLAEDETMINSMAEVLRLSFIKSISENFPDFKDVQRSFPKREKVRDDLVIVTEVCFFPDRTKTLQRLNVVRKEDGWRVLNLVQ